MHQKNQAFIPLGAILGFVVLCVVYRLWFRFVPSISEQTTQSTFELAHFGLFFFMVPIGSLWKKIEGLFPSDAPGESDINDGPITAYAKAFAEVGDKEKAKHLFLKAVRTLLNPKFVNLYLYNPEKPGFWSDNHKKNNDFLPVFVSLDSQIPQMVEKSREVLFFENNNNALQYMSESTFEEIKTNLTLLAPINIHSTLFGWVVIGPQENGQYYKRGDIQQIQLLTNLFSVAYEKIDIAQTYQSQNVEREIQTRITNTINTGGDLDLIMREIFNHLQEIVAIRDLSLIRRDSETGVYERIFSIQDKQSRVSPAKPESLNQEFLEKKALATGQITANEEEGSWITIPLHASAEITGALSLGSQHEQGVFQELDFSFFHFLGSSVSAAMQLHNLKQIKKRQTQQLDVFNKVSQQLTSIMHLESLLGNILDAAMNILECSSGIVMVIDEDQDELVFEVTAGPVASGLQGKRLPSNSGIAGQAFTNRKPIIRNQVDKSALWFRDKYPKSVENIENIIAAPLIAHGHVIGILELINKSNGLQFNETDPKVLQSFANQAAVAVHNASLYSETDQALEARVIELYIMQQIDRAMNATQDLDLALQRMLEAALQHTTARFGTISLVDQETQTLEKVWQIRPEENIPLMMDDLDLNNQPWYSETVFQSEMLESVEISTSLELPETAQWHHLIFSDLNEDQSLLLMLHTESAQHLTRHDRGFLLRLMDHGIIALKNALLYEELHEVIHAKNEFIGFISHELKNPLTVIKGYADILRKGMAGEVNEEQIDYLSTINHNVKRMNTFIKDLSDQAHIETKSLRLEFEPTPVQEVINEVLQSYEAQISEKSLQVVCQIPRDIPKVWCDRLRLIQILGNLISNAIKYSPEGRKIIVGTEQSANIWDEKGAAEVVHFWVEDNGYGISSEDQEHLFEKFYRGTDTRVKKIPGTGLGLRIAKSLVEMMGGKMWFESTVDEGSSFHFTLPI